MHTRIVKTIRPHFLDTARRFFTGNEALAGTVAFHNAYLLLHTRQSPTAYPGKVPSGLQRALQRAAGRWNGIVNLSWSPEQSVLPAESAGAEWDADDEAYCATAFSRYRGRMEIPVVSMQNLDAVVKQLEEHASYTEGLDAWNRDEDLLHLYVCTHGARDCRCGEHGGAVYNALRTEVERRGLSQTVKVGEVGHVGGHKYAANLLVYPYGEWLGHLRPEHVSEVLEFILAMKSDTFNTESTSPLLPHFWRGRMGLDKAEQLELISSKDTSPTTLQPHISRR